MASEYLGDPQARTRSPTCWEKLRFHSLLLPIFEAIGKRSVGKDRVRSGGSNICSGGIRRPSWSRYRRRAVRLEVVLLEPRSKMPIAKTVGVEGDVSDLEES